MTRKLCRLIPLMGVFLFLASVPALAKDQCCVVICGVSQDPNFPGIPQGEGFATCHHWDTFASWAATKCVGLGAVKGCSAQYHSGDCSDDRNCSLNNTIHSRAAQQNQNVGEPCKEDSECRGANRCAKLAFKKNRCVTPCESDSDCFGRQKCKKPFGTSFRRCK